VIYRFAEQIEKTLSAEFVDQMHPETLKAMGEVRQ